MEPKPERFQKDNPVIPFRGGGFSQLVPVLRSQQAGKGSIRVRPENVVPLDAQLLLRPNRKDQKDPNSEGVNSTPFL